MTSKKTMNTILAGAVATLALSTASTPANAMKDGYEKCYGVVKAGKNGCGSADKAHGCAGLAKEDASGVEWVSLPKGSCEKITGGSLEPIKKKDEDKKEH